MEQVKRFLLAGLGAAFYTKEKLEQVIDQLVETGQITREQGSKILEELVAKGREGQEEAITKFLDRIGPVLASVTPVSKSSFDSLVARVNDLAVRIDTLERRILLGGGQASRPPSPPPPQQDQPGPQAEE